METKRKDKDSSVDFLASDYASTPRITEPQDDKDPFEGRVDGLYLVLISLHGLVRGDRMELGKDPDTGGQVRHWCTAQHQHPPPVWHSTAATKECGLSPEGLCSGSPMMTCLLPCNPGPALLFRHANSATLWLGQHLHGATSLSQALSVAQLVNRLRSKVTVAHA